MTDPAIFGTRWRAHDGETYICAHYKDNAGFIMVNECNASDERCVSERALGRTFHRLPAPAREDSPEEPK